MNLRTDHMNFARLMQSLAQRPPVKRNVVELTAPPDLKAELAQCALELDECATLIALTYPDLASCYHRRARQLRDMLARAERA